MAPSHSIVRRCVEHVIVIAVISGVIYLLLWSIPPSPEGSALSEVRSILEKKHALAASLILLAAIVGVVATKAAFYIISVGIANALFVHRSVCAFRSFRYAHVTPLGRHLRRAFRRDDVLIQVSLGCTLDEYQTLLAELIKSQKPQRMEWTDIYRPAHLVEDRHGHREAFYNAHAEHRMQIFILSRNNKHDWEEDQQAGLVDELLNKCREANVQVRFVAEADLLSHMPQDRQVKVGDYALFDGSLLVSFNPTTDDDETGELWFAFREIDGYDSIFKAAEDEATRTWFYTDLERALNRVAWVDV